jgi:small subunit ribosomal protein S15e
LTLDELVAMYPSRARRRLSRGLKRKPKALINRLRKAKKEAVPGERPRGIKTHLRNMIIMPEMIGSVVGIYVRLVWAPSVCVCCAAELT